MLKFGLVLLGLAVFLGKPRKASASAQDDGSGGDSDLPPGGGTLKNWAPQLDSALNGNPFLIGSAAGGDGNPNTAPPWSPVHPPGYLGGDPGTGFLNNPGTTDDGTEAGAALSGSQLSAANNAYNKILGGIPARARANYNALHRAINWHRRVFHF